MSCANKIFAKNSREARRFRDDVGGHVVLTFALLLIPIIGAVGAAVDYSRASNVRTHLQNALDAAVLAAAGEAAKSASAKGVPAFVKKYVESNFVDKGTPQITSKVDMKEGVITGTAKLKVDSVLMQLMGIKKMDVAVSSEAMFGVGPTEIALALDTTGSMSGEKMTAAKQAANKLVDLLFAMPNAARNLKVSLVPFTYYVNVGLQYRTASWITGTNDLTTTSQQCWTDYPNAKYSNPYKVTATCYADGAPYDCSYTGYATVVLGTPVNKCGPVTSTSAWHGCVGSRNDPLDLNDKVSNGQPVPALRDVWCSAPLVRLTNSPSAIKTQIDSLVASGETYIAPGLLWAWRTLSPDTPFADGTAYSKKARKTIILMTDGANTHSPNYPNHEGSDVALANTLTSKTCINIKKTDIRVMTIAFSVADVAIKKVLQDCASSPSDFYDAGSIAAMAHRL
jgi:Flp pilus assembly protein TadG